MSLLTRSCYTKQVVIYHHRQGLKPGNISRKLQQEGIKATAQGIAKFLVKFIESGSVARKPWSGRPSKRNGPCNGTDRGTERNGWFYAVFRKTLSPSNANGTDRIYLKKLKHICRIYNFPTPPTKAPPLVHYRRCTSIGKCRSVHETCPLSGVRRLSAIREL